MKTDEQTTALMSNPFPAWLQFEKLIDPTPMSILKHSYPLSPAANGSRLWQFIFDTPQGEKRATQLVPVVQDEFEQAALVRAAIVRATL